LLLELVKENPGECLEFISLGCLLYPETVHNAMLIRLMAMLGGRTCGLHAEMTRASVYRP
jgi:hypothetical protein